jgi:hypothetical protein
MRQYTVKLDSSLRHSHGSALAEAQSVSNPESFELFSLLDKTARRKGRPSVDAGVGDPFTLSVRQFSLIIEFPEPSLRMVLAEFAIHWIVGVIANV